MTGTHGSYACDHLTNLTSLGYVGVKQTLTLEIKVILSKLIWLVRLIETRLTDGAYRHGRYLIGK